ncbi:uncharacterized protein DDB_G0290685 [Nematostella vectensis]|uniref:uncharacterized protein DDB_G0290685 n=1 Tax=Nematostella vectensis TaxID=45351 RepID=UPI0020774BB5|nr:uncharacterized protein DDB_G0290685 [Nematostella vectensis]
MKLVVSLPFLLVFGLCLSRVASGASIKGPKQSDAENQELSEENAGDEKTSDLDENEEDEEGNKSLDEDGLTESKDENQETNHDEDDEENGVVHISEQKDSPAAKPDNSLDSQETYAELDKEIAEAKRANKKVQDDIDRLSNSFDDLLGGQDKQKSPIDQREQKAEDKADSSKEADVKMNEPADVAIVRGQSEGAEDENENNDAENKASKRESRSVEKDNEGDADAKDEDAKLEGKSREDEISEHYQDTGEDGNDQEDSDY